MFEKKKVFFIIIVNKIYLKHRLIIWKLVM